MLSQLVIELALWRFELAVDGLLGARRQFAGDLILGAAQYERPQRLRQQLSRVLVRIPRRASRKLEHACRAQHAGVEEIEERPKLAQVVFYGRSAHRDAMPPVQ